MKSCSVLFLRELADWSMRGVLCALPSAAWAVISGYNRPPHFIGMTAGVAGFIVLFAAAYATVLSDRASAAGRFGQRLKTAVWIKAGLLLAGVPVCFLVTALGQGGEVPRVVMQAISLVAGIGSTWGWDMFSGMAVISAWRTLLSPFGLSFDLLEPLIRPPHAAVAITLAITLTQGVCVTIQLVLVGLVPRAWRWVRSDGVIFRRQKMVPE